MNESEGKGDLVRSCGVACEKMRLRVIKVIGMAMGRVGRGRRMGSSSSPRMVLSYLIPTSPRMTRKTLSPHPRSLGPRETPSHPVKLYFLLICLATSTIFLMKSISLIKIYLKLQLNLSHQIKSIYRKN